MILKSISNQLAEQVLKKTPADEQWKIKTSADDITIKEIQMEQNDLIQVKLPLKDLNQTLAQHLLLQNEDIAHVLNHRELQELNLTGKFLSEVTNTSLKQKLPNLKAGQRQIVLKYIKDNTPIAHLKFADQTLLNQKNSEIEILQEKLDA